MSSDCFILDFFTELGRDVDCRRRSTLKSDSRSKASEAFGNTMRHGGIEGVVDIVPAAANTNIFGAIKIDFALPSARMNGRD